ncbi:hypothetical protein Tco_0346777, partial [Tanacetum coccineum]
MVVQNQQELGEGSAILIDPHHTPNIVADDAIHKELGDSLLRAATTTSSLEVEHDS